MAPPPPNRRRPAGPRISARSSARGALIGLAVGDALGGTHEFEKRVAPPFPTLADGPQREMLGGGPHRLVPGETTDDTQMAVCLARSLRECGRYDAADAMGRYKEWLPRAFDAGTLTRETVSEARDLPSWSSAAKASWLRQSKNAAGNGSLMRSAPIAVAFAEDRDERISASLEDSSLTHYDPRCQLACAAFNGAIAAAIRGEARAPEDLLAAADTELSSSGSVLGRMMNEFRPETQRAMETLRGDLEAARGDDPMLYGPELHLFMQQGFVRVAFRLAFWELLHAPSFEAALIDVVNRGGDSDTNGAICGALLGAFHGEEAIPSAWRSATLNAVPRRPGGYWGEYQPRRMLELCG